MTRKFLRIAALFFIPFASIDSQAVTQFFFEVEALEYTATPGGTIGGWDPTGNSYTLDVIVQVDESNY